MPLTLINCRRDILLLLNWKTIRDKQVFTLNCHQFSHVQRTRRLVTIEFSPSIPSKWKMTKSNWVFFVDANLRSTCLNRFVRWSKNISFRINQRIPLPWANVSSTQLIISLDLVICITRTRTELIECDVLVVKMIDHRFQLRHRPIRGRFFFNLELSWTRQINEFTLHFALTMKDYCSGVADSSILLMLMAFPASAHRHPYWRVLMSSWSAHVQPGGHPNDISC